MRCEGTSVTRRPEDILNNWKPTLDDSSCSLGSVAMSVEQAIQELQEQLQRVSAGHQAMHQELTTLRSMVDTRSRVRLVEPETLMPDRFGKKNGSSWRT